MTTPSVTLLVVAPPNARYLKRLERLPDDTHMVVGNRLEMFEAVAAKADVVLNCVGSGLPLQQVWRMTPTVRWIHSMSAGVENTLFPELIESPVPLTNSRGVFARSLGEFAIAGILFFAKNLRRMVRSQEAGVWDQFDTVELHGQTVGIVGYGEIGKACAERARPFGMRIAALRRHPERTDGDGLVDRSFGPESLHELLAMSDYVVVSTPLTPQTRGLIGDAEFRSMKSSAVLINLGRGPVVVEEAMVRALSDRRIRGAALDVFDREPLPDGHPFYKLDNVLLSPHCADHTPNWQEDAMDFFVTNFERFRKGEPLRNVVDKKSGY